MENFQIVQMRLTGVDAQYYRCQLAEFTERMLKKFPDVTNIQYGKQDSRGGFSITFFDNKHCVPMQRQFSSKELMLGFVVGYNQAQCNHGYL